MYWRREQVGSDADIVPGAVKTVFTKRCEKTCLSADPK